MKYNKNEISPPAAKLIEVIEFLSFSNKEVSLKEISDKTRISQATLLRILNTLIEYGYISKNSEKKYVPYFKLHKSTTIPSSLEPVLAESLDKLVKLTGQSAEILTVKGINLFWHNKKEPENMEIKITAYPGFKRSMYELDAPSRLYLKFTGKKEIENRFDKNEFYNVSYEKCNWNEAVKIWGKENINQIAYDELGNGNGIRRYASLVTDEIGNFIFMLAVAEAAIPSNNTSEHIQKIMNALESETKYLKNFINNQKQGKIS
jgi:DNA-binding IclR family transcriptional regulator